MSTIDTFQKKEILVRRDEMLPPINYVPTHTSIRGLFHRSTLE